MPTRTIQHAGSIAGVAIDEREQDALDDLRAFLTIARTHPSDFGERQVFVRLDGGSRIALVYGESFTDELKPGSHTLRVHNTLVWKTVRFTIEPGEHLECQIVNCGRWWTYAMAGVLGSAPLFLKVQLRSRA